MCRQHTTQIVNAAAAKHTNNPPTTARESVKRKPSDGGRLSQPMIADDAAAAHDHQAGSDHR